MGESEGLLERVTSKLTESGLPLELRTARASIGAGFATFESFHYVDPIEHKTREGDVVVRTSISANGGEIPVSLVMECKDSSGKPWVGVYGTARRTRRTDDPSAWATSWQGSIKPALDELLMHGFDSNMREPCNRVLSPMTDSTKNPARGACLQVMSATHSLVNEVVEYSSDNEGREVATPMLGLALIVTTAPLFTCQLARDGSLDVQSVETFSVLCERPRNAGRSTIRVTTEAHLGHYLNTLGAATGRIYD